MSKRERLLARPRRTKLVTLVTGDVVEARPLPLLQRQRLIKSCMEGKEVLTEKLIPAIVIAAIFDPETNEPVFTTGDRETIEGMIAEEVDPMWEAAAELNGLSDDAEKVAEKN